MGSFSSKVLASRDNRSSRQRFETEENDGEMGEGGTEQQDEMAKEDNQECPSTSRQENSPPPRVRQSFSWLVDTPVILTTTGKEQKAKGKKCTEGKEKANYVLKYNNGNYLKSFEHFTDVPSSKTSSARQPKLLEPRAPTGKQMNVERSRHEKNK